MVDNAKFGSDSDEYKIQDESNMGTGGEYGVQFNTSAPLPSRPSRGKRLLVPVILMVVIIVVYQFLSWYSNRKAQSSLQQEEVVAQRSVQTPVPVAPARIIESEQVPAVRRGGPEEVSEMSVQQKLDILAMRTESNVGQLEKMKETVAQNQAELAGLTQSLALLEGSMKNLNDSVQKLVVAGSKAKVVKKVRRAATEVAPKVIYHVKAIVPGLAWLESCAGKTTAVRVGQKLPGYGTVRLISPKDGMVITSSGSVIQYGVNDF